jgi:exopolysaccharide production protein ExoY
MSEGVVGVSPVPACASVRGRAEALDGWRLLDAGLACALLVAALPWLLFLAILVHAADGGPALFVQPRMGRGGRVFRCLKFRSMAVDAEDRLNALLEHDVQARAEWSHAHKLRRDPRVTPLGRVLRAMSLDELPQLVNVIRGEMALVGPRPITEVEVPRYGRHYAAYCSRRPGLTGLWQVSGRHRLSYRRRVALDSWYARHACPGLDARILLRTAPAVLLGGGG